MCVGSSRSPETIEICAVGWPIGVTLRPLPCPSLPCRPLAYGVWEPGRGWASHPCRSQPEGVGCCDCPGSPGSACVQSPQRQGTHRPSVKGSDCGKSV